MILIPKKLYIVSGAFGLAIILIITLVVLPFINKIKVDSQELSQKKQALESFFQNWRDLESSKKECEEAKNRLNELPVLLPPREAIKFILAVEQFAQATQNYQTISVLKNIASSAASPAETAKTNTLDFQISLWGSFPNLIKFLIHLENASYYNDINSLQINRLTEKNISTEEMQNLSAGDINTILTVSVYQQDELSIK